MHFQMIVAAVLILLAVARASISESSNGRYVGEKETFHGCMLGMTPPFIDCSFIVFALISTFTGRPFLLGIPKQMMLGSGQQQRSW
jgi:hypothetical protein